jgi:ketosteroid isomerase-like protein
MSRTPLLAFVFVGAIAAASGCAQTSTAPADTSADKAKLEADSLVWFEHFANADADALANLYAEDAVLMPPGAAAVTGRPAIRTFLGELAAGTKAAGVVLKNGSSTSGVDGDTGWISGDYTAVDKSGATVDSGSYLSVHRRAGGSWLYIRDTWNSDRPPAPAPAASGTK